MAAAASTRAKELTAEAVTILRYFRQATPKHCAFAMVAPRQTLIFLCNTARQARNRPQCGRPMHYLLPYYFNRQRGDFAQARATIYLKLSRSKRIETRLWIANFGASHTPH